MAVLVVVWVLAAGFISVRAVRNAREGKHLLESVRQREGPSEVLRGTVSDDLAKAQRRFSRTSDDLHRPLLAPVRFLPFFGRQTRSFASLAMAGARASAVGAQEVAKGAAIVRRPAGSSTDRLAIIRDLGGLAHETDQRLGGIRLGPSNHLLPPLAHARDQLATELRRLREGLGRGSAAAEALDGWLEGPRRYLLFAANNAEMRAGSGMFLSVGEVTTSHGRLELGEVQSVTDVAVPPNAVPLEGDLAGRWGWLKPNQDWRNLMASPRFDTSAALAAQMWAASGHPPVDGVIALDPVTLQHLLDVVGGVSIDNREIDADNVLNELFHDQYVRFPTDEAKPERRELLGRLAQEALRVVDAGKPSVTDLAGGLAGAVRGRHLMAWSARPGEEAGWQAAGVGGTTSPNSLLVSVLNRGGNKLDQFLQVSADLQVESRRGDTLGTLRLLLDNVTPDGQPAYIAGPYPGSGLGAGDYLGIVTVDLPGTARDARIEGVEQLGVAGADGPSRVLGFQLVIPKGAQRAVTVRFRLPGDHGSVRVEPTARVPGVRWRAAGQTWGDGKSHTLRW